MWQTFFFSCSQNFFIGGYHFSTKVPSACQNECPFRHVGVTLTYSWCASKLRLTVSYNLKTCFTVLTNITLYLTLPSPYSHHELLRHKTIRTCLCFACGAAKGRRQRKMVGEVLMFPVCCHLLRIEVKGSSVKFLRA